MVSVKKKLVLSLTIILGFLFLLLLSTQFNDSTTTSPTHHTTHLHVEEDIVLRLETAIKRGIVSKVVINQPLFNSHERQSEESNVISRRHTEHHDLERQIHRENPPQNTFQWMYDDNATLVYSAHFDNRDGVVKIVGFKHRFKLSTSDAELVLCRYPDNSVVPMVTLYNVSVVQPRPGLEFNTWIWTCAWAGTSPPASLSLITQSQKVLIDRLNITYHIFPQGAEKVKQPVLCIKPMVNNYSDAYQLREFIESSRMWGVGKIVLYPQSIHKPTIQPIIDKYKREGYVDTHQWEPPVPMKSLHAFGQKSHNQHCLYTYMYRYQWAAFIDLDELIVANESIGNMEFMLQAGVRSVLDGRLQSQIAGFILRSQMCTTSLPDDPIYGTPEGKYLCRITSFRKTNCTIPMKPGVWSKPIVNTDGTEVVDIHIIRLARPGYLSVDLDPSIATIHHYRALKRTSQVLAESAQYKVLKRNTHIYKYKARKIFGEMCDFNNPNIGDIQYSS